MIDSAFEALVHQRLHVVLSSDRPLALQHSALLLLRRLHQDSSVRVADEAPADPTELISHVNQIVAGLSLKQATDNAESVSRLAILPVRVGPDRPADSIALLIRLCRALPGTGLRLLLIIEHEPAVDACMRALSGAAYHWDIRSQPASDVDRHGVATQPSDLASTVPLGRAEALNSTPLISQPDNAAAPESSDTLPQPLREQRASQVPPITRQAGWFSKLADSASRRPLRFALFVAGIPGLLIAGVLAVGSALQPSRSGAPSSAAGPATATPAPSPARPTAAAAPPPAPPPSSLPATPPPAPAPAAAAKPPTTPPVAKQASTPTPTQATPAATAKPASGNPVSPAAQQSAPPPAQAVAAAPVASNTPSAPPASATAPSSNAPSTERRTTPQPAAAAGNPTAPAFECTPATTPPPQVQPRNPSKDSGMVYMTSTKPVLVCVTDGSGTVTRQQINPDQGQSFFGKAPWQVQAASLRDLQFFFQGSRITVPRNATDRIELIERTN